MNDNERISYTLTFDRCPSAIDWQLIYKIYFSRKFKTSDFSQYLNSDIPRLAKKSADNKVNTLLLDGCDWDDCKDIIASIHLCLRLKITLSCSENIDPAKKHLFLCDILKNKECTKESCIINGGPCMMTHDPQFAYGDLLKEVYSVDDLQDWAGYVGRC